jgi:hypothetical protein
MLENKNKLEVVWTSGDRDVALKMVFMYVLNSRLKNWWEDITLIVWGPSANLLSQDYELQEYLEKIMEQGVTLEACINCTEMYGVTKKLSDLGINAKLMGPPLTGYVKEGRSVITF